MRKLFHIALGYCAALILAHYFLPLHILPYISAAAFVISFAAFFFKSNLRARIFMLVIPFALGLFWTWAHNELFVREATELSDRECTASVVVLDYPKTGDYYSSVLVRLTDEDMPRTKVRISSYDYDLSALNPGMHISIPLKFATIKTDDSFDKASSYGVYSYAYVTGDYATDSSRFNTLIHLQKSAANAFKETVYKCFPEDVAPFTAALLTGDKTQLYKDTALYSALATAGLAHIVAVSGMHLSFITGFCRMITGRRRRTAFICIPVIVAFMALVASHRVLSAQA